MVKRDGIVEGADPLNSVVEIRLKRCQLKVGIGVWRRGEEVVVEMSEDRVVEVNVRKKELLRVNEKDVSGIEHNQVLDLSDEGERWEGDVLERQPYGWEVFYDRENNMMYEGFRIGDVSVCYGRSYYSDIEVIEYEGELLEGKRWGKGIMYDRNGKVLFDGEWLNDNGIEKRVVMSEKNPFLHNCIEELSVSDGSCNGEGWKALDLALISSLRELRVGDRCFRCVSEVKLIGLKRLEKVKIGNTCFSKWDSTRMDDSDGRFYLKDCERVKELKIGCDSFFHYSVCEIENVNSLEVIEMGEMNKWSFNFRYSSLELKSEL